MKPEHPTSARLAKITPWLAAFICCGVVALAWFGYRAAEEWRRSSSQLVERRTREVADLLVTALGRDMRAVQVSVLDGRDWDAAAVAAPYELNDTVEAAFARYPYPEAFFAWTGGARPAVFFARSDRRAAWLPPSGREDRYPVEVVPAPQLADPLFARIARDIAAREQYSTFEVQIGGKTYQAVARLVYQDFTRDRSAGVFGFIVDLNWVRENYFSTITEQVTRIAQAGDGVASAVVDERGQTIVGVGHRTSVDASTRPFPVFFFDPIIVASGPPADLVSRTWSVTVSAGQDPTLAIAARGARRTLLVVGAGALALGLGLVVTVRAGQAAADTAAMRADFVSTVTHGLKTPVSVIRGIGETLIRGRVTTPDKLREYAQLLVNEGHRLSRLIDNMLAYARVADAADVYAFEPQAPADVVDEALKGFQRILSDAGFTPIVSISPALPAIRADRTSLVLALDNLLDNAIRYSGDSRSLAIDVRLAGAQVEFSVVDRGNGIPASDLARVQRRFARGRSTTGHGSGLGLSIVSRIATDHGGRLRLESAPGEGTTATIAIPVFAD